MAGNELKIDHETESATPAPQPGQVVSPGGAQPAPPPPVSQVERPVPPVTPPDPTPTKQSDEEAKPAQAEAQHETFTEESQQPDGNQAGEITWTASEFIAHEKSASWYLGIALAGVLVAGVVFLITKDYISAVVVLVGTFSLAVLGAKKPKQQAYRLDNGGLTVGQKHYEYHAFKSFAVVPEGAFSSIVFMPLKRFAPLTTIYYPPEEEHQIADLLAKHLPLETHKVDAVDRLMQRIRF